MRKVIAQQWISADGYAADANGTTHFFEDRKWGKGSDEDLLAHMDQLDTILLGANTYKMFREFWPTTASEGEIIADRLNEMPKIVFSNTLEAVNWGKWNTAILQHGEAVDAVKKLKVQAGKNMVLWGSISLMQSLLNAGLVDELHLRTVPVLLGVGRPLFGNSAKIELETTNVKKYKTGLVLTEFRVLG